MQAIVCKKCKKPFEFSELWLKAKTDKFRRRFVNIPCPKCGFKNLSKADISPG